MGIDFLSNCDNFFSFVISLKAECVRIYMESTVDKPVTKPHFFTNNLRSFVTKFCFQHKKVSALPFLLCCKNSSHYRIQLNNCTKPFINGHLWWVKHPNLLLWYQMREGHLALGGGPAWKGLWHGQEWTIWEKRKGHFPPLKAFRSAWS